MLCIKQASSVHADFKHCAAKSSVPQGIHSTHKCLRLHILTTRTPGSENHYSTTLRILHHPKKMENLGDFKAQRARFEPLSARKSPPLAAPLAPQMSWALKRLQAPAGNWRYRSRSPRKVSWALRLYMGARLNACSQNVSFRAFPWGAASKRIGNDEDVETQGFSKVACATTARMHFRSSNAMCCWTC